MKTYLIAAGALVALTACAGPVPPGFDGNASRTGNTLVIPSVSQPTSVPPPSPVRTTSLDGPASSPIPLPSTNGMPPPPVEVGVVGPAPAALPPLVMDEDLSQ